jgi:hypothetical protein
MSACLPGKAQAPAQERARSTAFRHFFRLPARGHSNRLMIGSGSSFFSQGRQILSLTIHP